VPSKAEVKPMCASGYPPFVDPKSHPFYSPPRDPGGPLLAPQPVKPVPAKPLERDQLRSSARPRSERPIEATERRFEGP